MEFFKTRCSKEPSSGPVSLYNCSMQSLGSGAIGLLDFMLACCSSLCISEE